MREGIGRVFPGAIIRNTPQVGYQLLSNHQQNVVRLLEAWRQSPDDSPLLGFQATYATLLEAARHHDDGKVETFRFEEKNGALTYSFSGHRFRVSNAVTNPYARALIRGHHDFSTQEVVNAAAEFVTDPTLRRRFARDLYILEMADQLEAELINRALGAKQTGENVRPFVEFDIEQAGERSWQVSPWPFEDKEGLILRFEVFWRQLDGSPDSQRLWRWGQELARGSREAFTPEEYTVKLLPGLQIEVEERSQPDIENFYRKFNLNPHPYQQEVWRRVWQCEAVLLEAPTGRGKTEAVAFPALASGMRLVLVLPARSLVDDQRMRFERYLLKLAKETKKTYTLVVDTGHAQHRLLCSPNQDKPLEVRGRHLYKADVILTTLDKYLYRFFGYGPPRKSYTFPHRIHDRNTFFVFDEAHSYDGVAWTNFRLLVRALYLAGLPFALMTATMPKSYQEALSEYLDDNVQDPVLSRPPRQLHYLPQGNFLDLAQAHAGRQVILSVNTVAKAAELYKELQGPETFLYHGRLAPEQREKVYRKIKHHDEAKKPYLLVTTSAIEVGVDLDAEVLISEICPPENLLQRMGPVNRRGTEHGEIYVVGGTLPDYLQTMPPEAWNAYVLLLKELDGVDLAEGGETRLREAIATLERADPRAETHFSMLYEYVYDYLLENEPLYMSGFIATRSWEPTVHLEVESYDHSIEVPIGRLATSKKEDIWSGVEVCERIWPSRERGREPTEILLRSGELYRKEIVIKYPAERYDPQLGFVELPKVFRWAGWHTWAKESPYRRVLYYAPADQEESENFTDAGGAVFVEGASQSRRAFLYYLGDESLESRLSQGEIQESETSEENLEEE